jgi:CDP-4-dehydro-6-deoxyglucose reductase
VIHAFAADFDDLSEHAIYLCGSPAMISSAKQDFIGRCASMEHIYTEGFTLKCARPAPA